MKKTFIFVLIVLAVVFGGFFGIKSAISVLSSFFELQQISSCAVTGTNRIDGLQKFGAPRRTKVLSAAAEIIFSFII